MSRELVYLPASLGPSLDDRTVRLSVNLPQEAAQVLRAICGSRGIPITEGIRRAIALLQIVERLREEGGKFLLVSNDGRERELVVL